MADQGTRPASLKRIVSNLEPNLQHQGVIYSFLLFYGLLNLIIFVITAAPAWRDTEQDATVFRIASIAARGGGAMLDVNAAIIILVASRTLMTYLRQTVLNLCVPFDKAMPAFHSLVGNILCISTFIHATAHIIRYVTKLQTGRGFLGPVSLAISGSLLTVILAAMRITSIVKLRKKSFETFYFVHYIGFISFYILLIMHGSHKSVLKTWMYVIFPIFIYLVDRFIRLRREFETQVPVSQTNGNIKGPSMVCLRIPRSFSYLAGQYCDVKIPALSHLQWHPFTIASSPHESEMRFYIKCDGDWTRSLYNLFNEHASSNNSDPIHVHVRGPYGAPAQHVGQYEHVVLISGGVGATPMVSISKYAHHWISNYTTRGAAVLSNSVSATFTRNQSVLNSPSISGTPTTNVSNMSNRSRNCSRPISRSGSGKIERFNSGRMTAASEGSIREQSVPNSYGITFVDTPKLVGGASNSGNTSAAKFVDDAIMHRFVPSAPDDGESGEGDDMGRDNERKKPSRPDDYDDELGNPSLPIPDRRAIGKSPSRSDSRHPIFEITNNYDSQIVFDEGKEHVGGKESLNRDVVIMESRHKLDEIDLETGNLRDEEGEECIEVDNGNLRERPSSSNANRLLDMSSGPRDMEINMEAVDSKQFRSGVVRVSVNLRDNVMDGAEWYDRIIYYFHTVTVNWILLWLMMIRFTMVFIGFPSLQFTFSQRGLGVFESNVMNAIDLVLAILTTIPILGAITMEIFISNIPNFVSESIGNSFDLFVMLPLLLFCIGLHVLNFVNIGETQSHLSKLTVCFIWPVLSLLIVWRIKRTIGSHVALAPSYRATHSQTKSLDYIWVGKTHEEDSWLIDELLPLAGSSFVRLHRYITKDKPKPEPRTLEYEKDPFKTTYSRPDWGEIFGGLVDRSKSGSVIGVFFCGPDGMARMIQQAAMKAMSKSMDNAYARGYFSKIADITSDNIIDENNNNIQSNCMDVNSSNHTNGVMDMMHAGASNENNPSNANNSMRRLNGGCPGMPMPTSGSVNESESSQKAGGDNAPDYGCAVKFVIRVENFT